MQDSDKELHPAFIMTNDTKQSNIATELAVFSAGEQHVAVATPSIEAMVPPTPPIHITHYIVYPL